MSLRRRELEPDEVAELHDWLASWIERIVISPALRRGRKAVEDVPVVGTRELLAEGSAFERS